MVVVVEAIIIIVFHEKSTKQPYQNQVVEAIVEVITGLFNSNHNVDNNTTSQVRYTVLLFNIATSCITKITCIEISV